MKKTSKLIAFLFALALIFLPQTRAENTIKVVANDTVAGYSTSFKTSYTNANKSITFRVKKPDGAVVEISATTNEIGIAQTDFVSFHTKKAGKYEVSAAATGQNQDNALTTTFTVYPDELSETTSSVYIDPPSLAADGIEQALVKVSLRDKYNNPVSKQSLLIVSSRPADEITTVNNTKIDENGNVFYQISSNEAGISYLTVLDQVSGKVLESRPKVVFYEPDLNNPQGGNWFQANIFGDSSSSTNTGSTNTSADITDSGTDNDIFGPIDYFEIDFPSQVTVGSDQNFLTIVAKDSEGRTVKSYTGTIIISTPNDENAILPGDGQYTFQARDQGERTFDLALIFSKTGRQSIQVYDFDQDTGEISESIKGEKIVEVIEGTSNPDDPITTDSELAIKKPTEGSSGNSSTVAVVGKARANTNIKIFIDDVKVDEAEVDSDGFFSKEVQNISDGQHTIFIKESEGSQQSSAMVNFEIDTTPPTLDEFSIIPEGGVEAGKSFEVEVYSDPLLDAVTFQAGTLNEELFEDESQRGRYSLKMVAPENPGEYTVTLVLTDDMQNSARFSNVGTLKVLPKDEVEPATINDFNAEAQDSAAKLSWQIEDLPDTALQLKISYGLNKFNLNKNKTLALDSTEAVIESLENDQEYFFKLEVLDSENNSVGESGIISTTPAAEHAAANEFTATSGNAKVFLRWTATEDADHYQVKILVYGTQYLETMNFAGTSTTAAIDNLINGQKYVFSVTPKNAQGSTIEAEYPLAIATPTWDGTHPAANTPIISNYTPPKNEDVGPMANKIAFSSLLIILALLLFRKAIVIYRR